ncbi:cytochrome-c peroxidase [Neoroseomonas rubea]|uniref:cytochrome-c peroxidase n=1 Tax=Neoroseomonas rubea TaxID=2748666 RepID=UPI0018DF86DB|nr:cytochrome c peroxidase [Roseomonas rubea]
MRLASRLLLALLLAATGASAAEIPTTEQLRAMYRRPEVVPFPAANAHTPERAMLGRILFFDPRLSSSNLLSCASCHNPSFGWGDGQALGRGHGMVRLGRRSPTVLNAAWGGPFFWDGRAPTLEAQAAGPIAAAVEMNMPLAELPGKLAGIAGYAPLFEAAYPGEGITVATITRAIATFERTIVAGRSDFDRWVDGDDGAISAAARRGLDVFQNEGRCAACHSGWPFTDNRFHDIGLPTGDIGRAEFDPANPLARHAFKTPGLRDTVRRAPYMHNGVLADLEAVVRFYETGGQRRPSLSPLMQPLSLTDRQREDLLAFLATLSAPIQEFRAPTLPR